MDKNQRLHAPIPPTEKTEDSFYLQVVLNDTETHESPLPWQILSSLVQGLSVIEHETLSVKTSEEAHRLLKAYGYDSTDAEDMQAMALLIREAVSFIENRLLEVGEGESVFAKLNLHVPDRFLQQQGIHELLYMASETPRTENARWACAILKVVHTLIHIEQSSLLQIIEPARQQILKGYGEIMRYDLEQEKVVIGHPQSSKQLALYGLEIKEQKSRESLLIKLLSKKENSIEMIDDFIGIRIITESIPDVLVALDILMDSQLLVASNVKAERSRNTLIALEEFQNLWQKHHPSDFQKTESNTSNRLPTWYDLLNTLKKLDAKLPQHSFSGHNPHSDNDYRAFHITTRQLIKVPARGVESGKNQRLFFPYEIQFIDKYHYLANQQGNVAHNQYKQRQLQRCRRRVLGDLLPQHFREHPHLEKEATLKRPLK